MKRLLLLAIVVLSIVFFALNSGVAGPKAEAGVQRDNLPDLVVSYMYVTFEAGNDCHWPGHPLGTRVWVQNKGSADAGAFDVALSVTTHSGQITVSSGLQAGQYTSVWFPFSGYIGNIYTATVDANSQVIESDENNNVLSTEVAVPTPPLTCTPAPTATATPAAVGGIAEPPDAAASGGSSGVLWRVLAIAGLLAMIGVVGVAYAGRRYSVRRR
jgi:CARDB